MRAIVSQSIALRYLKESTQAGNGVSLVPWKNARSTLAADKKSDDSARYNVVSVQRFSSYVQFQNLPGPKILQDILNIGTQ